MPFDDILLPVELSKLESVPPNPTATLSTKFTYYSKSFVALSAIFTRHRFHLKKPLS